MATLTERARKLQKYLEESQRNLYYLRRDIEFAPFSRNSENKIVVAIDWSEVYSYILGTTPSALLQTVVGTIDLVAAHQAALTVLFDRNPFGSLLLLPPYETEMHQFVRLCHSRALPVALDDSDRNELLAQLEQSE